MNDPQIIRPGSFTPSSEEIPRQSGLSRRALLLGAAGLMMLAILAALLTARSVTINVEPAEGRFRLDGLLLFELGGTYLGFPGEYHLEASAEGYETYSGPLQIASSPRAQSQTISLTPLPGRVSFTSTPAGASVVVDGTTLGVTPLPDQPLPKGTYQLFVTHPGYEDHRTTVEVAGLDQAQSETIELLPDWADVAVSSDPIGATILLNGEPLEATTPATVPVPSGFAELTLKLPGYKARTFDLEVEARVPQTLPPATLELADGLVNVITSPAGAGHHRRRPVLRRVAGGTGAAARPQLPPADIQGRLRTRAAHGDCNPRRTNPVAGSETPARQRSGGSRST